MTRSDPDTTARKRTGATTWIAAGSTANGVAALGFQVIGTRSLGPDAYAPIGVLWTLQYLWVAVAMTAIEAYVTRVVTVHGADADQLHRFLGLLVRWLVLAAVCAALIGWALRDALFAGLGDLAVVLGLVTLGYAWHGVVRGRAAGAGRFRAYALATAGESVLRLLLALIAIAAAYLVLRAGSGGGTLTFGDTGTRALAWVFPLGPLTVAAWAYTRGHPTAPRRRARSAHADTAMAGTGEGIGRRFLLATSTANAAVQFLLAGGPIVLVPLGADAATISVFFTTITAARVPMTFALNGGLSRILPPLTRMATAGDASGLRRATVAIVLGIAGVGVLGAAVGALLGPPLIAVVFGADFRPGRLFVGVVALGTVLAVGGLVLDQLYIAAGRERRLPLVWAVGLLVAGIGVLTLPYAPPLRVATAFMLGTAVAVTALGVPLLRTLGALTANQPPGASR